MVWDISALKNKLRDAGKQTAPLGVKVRSFLNLSSTQIESTHKYRFMGMGVIAVMAMALFLPKPVTNANTSTVKPTTLASDIDLSRFDVALEMPETRDSHVVKLKIKSGQSLGPLLQKNGLSGPQAYKVTQAFSKVFKPRNVRVGQEFDLYFEDDILTHLSFRPNIDKTIFVSRSDDDYTAKVIESEFKMGSLRVKSTIENSLYLDASRLGAPDKVIQQFAKIYEYSVDFQRDIQPGDSFEMFFEVARDHKGNIIKAGDLLYTSFSPRGKTSNFYLYEDSKGRENFYDSKGKTAKRKLRATPINGARLSSRYGNRRHPILGYKKFHAGVDFAAPRGTPILAAGSGTVERANRYGGYGNYIRIRHSDGYKTAYAHLKNFARGIKKGKYIKQDQVIGYVGTTGRSTGPHLHYEVHHNGKKINPRRLSQLSGKPLRASEIAAFKKRRGQIDALREKAEILQAETLSAQTHQDETASVDTVSLQGGTSN